MATSIEQIRKFLDEFDLRYQADEESAVIVIGFRVDPELTSYRDRDGDAHVGLVIRLVEDGEFLSVFAPWAWSVHGSPHKAAVFEALASIQSRSKLLRFDYDPADGEIRPNVELPLDDAELTDGQFHRSMHAVMHGIQRFDGVIRHAMETGEVSFESVEQDEFGTPPEIVQLRQFAAEAGGIEALERIACGCAGDEPTDEETVVALSCDPDQPGQPPASTADVQTPRLSPQVAIRRIWNRLFGRSRPDGGAERRAG